MCLILGSNTGLKLFIVGGNHPVAKELIGSLRRFKIRFQAPADKRFDPDNGVAIAKMVTDYSPTLLINLADFISGNHGALNRAETSEQRCEKINALLPGTLAEICNHLNIPMLQISNAYVFDGEKKLGYNENDDTNPVGVYGKTSMDGELAVQKHNAHIIIRSGWLFGKYKKGLIKSWIRSMIKNGGMLQVSRRRFSPTHTGDLATAILAVCQQVDCEASVWGTYHYTGLETKKESEFAEQTLRYAANHDEQVYQLLDNIKITEREAKPPEIHNSTLSSKRIFDTFGIKPKSWHGHLQGVIKSLYSDRLKGSADTKQEAISKSSAA
jgi:dTDP-4-dehydrorhamnose reductase